MVSSVPTADASLNSPSNRIFGIGTEQRDQAAQARSAFDGSRSIDGWTDSTGIAVAIRNMLGCPVVSLHH